MARCGNHGVVIPRDREVLSDLYWGQQKSLPDIARIFDVTHKSVERVFRELGIERRQRHVKGQSRFRQCIKCGEPVFKINHTNNRSQYGKLCREHWNEHRAKLARDYAKQPKVRAKNKFYLKRWYYIGSLNPEGNLQWLNQNKNMLRNVRRLLLKSKTQNHEALAFLSAASKLEPNLQI